MEQSAVISPCGSYRYTLTRLWNEDKPGVLFVMLNPSTADADRDDPTIRRCMGFAQAWKCGAITVVNLFAYRATTPAVLASCAETAPEIAVGPENNAAIRRCVDAHSGPRDYIVAAWGADANRPILRRRRDDVMQLLPRTDLMCLDITRGGAPRHPLYCRADLTPTPYEQRMLRRRVFHLP